MNYILLIKENIQKRIDYLKSSECPQAKIMKDSRIDELEQLLNSPTINIEEIWDESKKKVKDQASWGWKWKYPTLQDFLKEKS